MNKPIQPIPRDTTTNINFNLEGLSKLLTLIFDQNKKLDEIIHLVNINNKNQIKTMADIAEIKQQVTDLKAKVVTLQTSLDAEQEQIKALLDSNAQVVTDLNNKIAELQAIIDGGGVITPADLQEVSTGLTEISASIATTEADLEGTV